MEKQVLNQLFYGVKNKDKEEQISSRSGGLFPAIAKYVLDRKGVVFGATYDETLTVIHTSAETKEGITQFKGSKYVQSQLNDTFKLASQYLKEKRMVLFSGTPCQIAGLKNYLQAINANMEHLILCDIVCHGVGSPAIYKDYLSWLETKYDAHIMQFNFRDKERVGWSKHKESVTFSDGTKEYGNTYQRLYSQHLIMRPSCYCCRWANFNRPGDITMGDFWGVEERYPEFFDDRGNSLVIINTEKGERVFQEISNHLHIIQVKKEECGQPNLHMPTPYNAMRVKLFKLYRKKGFDKVRYEFATRNIKIRIKEKFLRIFKSGSVKKTDES